jgi:phosphopentomutase
MKFSIIVLDSVGVGELPDAAKFGAPPGDGGSHTLNHTLERSGAQLPNLARLGLGNIPGVTGVPSVPEVHGAFGRMLEVSPGKDTST